METENERLTSRSDLNLVGQAVRAGESAVCGDGFQVGDEPGDASHFV